MLERYSQQSKCGGDPPNEDYTLKKQQMSISDIFIKSHNSEVIPIDKTKPDWNRIRTEYQTGTASLRDLSKKYGVPWSTLRARAYREKWGEGRKNAQTKIEQKVVKEAEKKAADNATLAADIKRKGLLILDRLMDEFETVKGTEHRDYTGRNLTDIKRLRDLTAAYKDLTDDMAKPEETENPLLRSLYDLMKENANAD